MLTTIHENQYVHPTAKPPKGPTYRCAYSLNEPDSGSATAISPRARMTMKMMPPPMTYPNKTAGPARPIVFADP